jgi:hypothetical protein
LLGMGNFKKSFLTLHIPGMYISFVRPFLGFKLKITIGKSGLGISTWGKGPLGRMNFSLMLTAKAVPRGLR